MTSPHCSNALPREPRLDVSHVPSFKGSFLSLLSQAKMKVAECRREQSQTAPTLESQAAAESQTGEALVNVVCS